MPPAESSNPVQPRTFVSYQLWYIKYFLSQNAYSKLRSIDCLESNLRCIIQPSLPQISLWVWYQSFAEIFTPQKRVLIFISGFSNVWSVWFKNPLQHTHMSLCKNACEHSTIVKSSPPLKIQRPVAYSSPNNSLNQLTAVLIARPQWILLQSCNSENVFN